MCDCDRAAILRQHVDALNSQLSELKILRDRVLKAEQPTTSGTTRARRKALVSRAVLARPRSLGTRSISGRN